MTGLTNMNARRIVVDTPATPHFDFLFGRYRLSPWVIPYFSTIIPIRDAAASLRLAADFPGSDDVMWRLDELYQREIDWPRVERKIVPYLHATDQPQFFNALTIALLPLENDLSALDRCFGNAHEWLAPELTDAKRFEKTLTAGPISCGFWTAWTEFSQAEAKTGQLRWNPNQVFAVALDGQHRLAAIKEFVKKKGKPDRHMDDTSVPVIFVVLDPAFGYVAPRPTPLVEVLRTVFIDLNKHAKIPTRARQILLDDKDPASICVRALIGGALRDGTDELRERPVRMPLSLVDWHTEQAKFDDGPYVTTILALDWAIAELTGAKPVQDFTDYSAIRRQLKALAQSLAIDLSAAQKRLDGLEKFEMRPFGFSEEEEGNELDLISNAFQRVWNPVFTELLTEFTPYRRLIEFRTKKSAFTLDFANWYRLRWQHKKDRYAGRATEEYRQFLGRLATKTAPVSEQQLDEVLSTIEREIKRDNLAFNVVFQRAYFLAFVQLRLVTDWHLDELAPDDVDFSELDAGDANDSAEPEALEADLPVGDGPAGDSIDERTSHLAVRAKRFVTAMNALVDAVPNILHPECTFTTPDGEEQRFWLGTFLSADRGIDFTQAASRRGQEVIFWAVAMQMYDELVEPDTHSDFDDFWSRVGEADMSFTGRVWRSVKRFSDKETSAGGRILAARGERFEVEQSRNEARSRMSWLWDNLKL